MNKRSKNEQKGINIEEEAINKILKPEAIIENCFMKECCFRYKSKYCNKECDTYEKEIN